jgi:hypothetical protein
MQTMGIPKVPFIARFFSFYDSASISHDKWKQVIHCRSPQAATQVSENCSAFHPLLKGRELLGGSVKFHQLFLEFDISRGRNHKSQE